MKIGIMGGTFNPIHYGHLLIGEYARTSLGLEKVVYIPTGSSYHKEKEGILPGSERYNMVKLAIETNPYFSLSDIEIKRSGNTYTIDTIRAIRDREKYESIFFIIGEDSLLSLDGWKDLEELSNLCEFLVFRRGSNSLESLLAAKENLREKYGTNIEFLDSPIFDISSTEIRNRIKDNKSIKYLLPEKVEDYIFDKGLYGAD